MHSFNYLVGKWGTMLVCCFHLAVIRDFIKVFTGRGWTDGITFTLPLPRYHPAIQPPIVQGGIPFPALVREDFSGSYLMKMVYYRGITAQHPFTADVDSMISVSRVFENSKNGAYFSFLFNPSFFHTRYII